ncbi:MAG: helix-hairpin-helix domain-containing protein [Planctomycetota bacterium]
MSKPLLRQADQLSIAVLTVAAIASVALWWWMNGGAAGELVNIERAPPVGYRYLVDVNTAGWPELAQLPKVGETLARRIVEQREVTGPYQTPDDLLEVNGIGEKTLESIRGYLLPLPGDGLTASP